MGSATVVASSSPAGGPQKAPEKYQSFMRSTFRALAKTNGYPVRLAEAMVDEDIEVIKVRFKDEIHYITDEDFKKFELQADEENVERPVDLGVIVCPKGKLLNMSADEAIKYGFAKKANSVKDICADLKIANPEIELHKMTWVENTARVISGSILSGLLLTIGMIATYYALAQPGFAIPEAVAIMCFTVFFWGRFFVGMAGPMEISLFLIGAILLAVELFLIPGFGVTGGIGVFFILVFNQLQWKKIHSRTVTNNGRL